MRHLRDVIGICLLVVGVGGVFSGIRGVTGDAWWGGPCIGVGVAANALAYRTMRPTPKRAEEAQEGDRADSSS